MLTLGIDIGRVIIAGGDPGRPDTSFFGPDLEDALATPAVAGALETIPRLVERFDGRVWLVSKCGARVEGRTRAWLEARDFFRRTGIPEAQARFCRQRPEKADLCRELGVTHFIDDRIDVLEHLRGQVPWLFHFGTGGEGAAAAGGAGWYVTVPGWEEAERAVLASLAEERLDPAPLVP